MKKDIVIKMEMDKKDIDEENFK